MPDVFGARLVDWRERGRAAGDGTHHSVSRNANRASAVILKTGSRQAGWGVCVGHLSGQDVQRRANFCTRTLPWKGGTEATEMCWILMEAIEYSRHSVQPEYSIRSVAKYCRDWEM